MVSGGPNSQIVLTEEKPCKKKENKNVQSGLRKGSQKKRANFHGLIRINDADFDRGIGFGRLT